MPGEAAQCCLAHKGSASPILRPERMDEDVYGTVINPLNPDTMYVTRVYRSEGDGP